MSGTRVADFPFQRTTCQLQGIMGLLGTTWGMNYLGEDRNWMKTEEGCRSFRPVSNRGPFACEANVITTTLRKLTTPGRQKRSAHTDTQ